MLKGENMNSGKKLFRTLQITLSMLLLSGLFAAAVFADGKAVYDQNCASCHRLGTYDTSGSAPNLLGKGSSIDSYYKAGVSGHKGITLSSTNITELKTFINNPTTTTALAISTASLPGATVGTGYSQTLAATGGRTPYTWSRTSGTLPSGLSLSSIGVISGTPSATGTFSFTVRVTDSSSTPVSVSKTLSITVAAAATTGGGKAVYDQNCASCHRLGTYDTSGSAPNLLGKGSSIDSYYKAGVSGHKGITLSSTNITELKTFINNPTTTTALAISTASLPGATVSTGYSQTLAATGGRTPYTWSRTSGTLPSGLSLSSAGVISGIPSATGTFSFTVRVTDSSSTPVSVSKTLSITVAAVATTPLSITSTNLNGGTVGTAYSQTLIATGGTTPYTWSYSGSLPAGLGFTSAGSIVGTPTASGSYTFTARVTDSRSTAVTKSLTITIASPPMSQADKDLFLANCGSCHTPYGLQNRTAAEISATISSNAHGMGTTKLRSLTSANISSIARSLVPAHYTPMSCNECHSSSSPAPAPAGSAQAIYDSQCAGCHSLGTYDTSGSPNLLGRGSTVSGKFSSAHYGITLTATDKTNIAAFLNNPTPSSPSPTPSPTPTTGQGVYDASCASCHRMGTYDTSGTAPDLNQKSALVDSYYTAGTSGHKGITLSSTDISNLKTFFGGTTTSPTPTSCTSCHGNPPSTGSHSDHRSRSCSSCHGSGFSSTTVNSATHNNGVKNVISSTGWNASNRSCSSNSCHGSESW
jgi:mono/diheme cytochrome c family protein